MNAELTPGPSKFKILESDTDSDQATTMNGDTVVKDLQETIAKKMGEHFRFEAAKVLRLDSDSDSSELSLNRDLKEQPVQEEEKSGEELGEKVGDKSEDIEKQARKKNRDPVVWARELDKLFYGDKV